MDCAWTDINVRLNIQEPDIEYQVAPDETYQDTAIEWPERTGSHDTVAAVDLQARRVSPQFLRQLIGVSGRAARFFDRALGGRKERQ